MIFDGDQDGCSSGPNKDHKASLTGADNSLNSSLLKPQLAPREDEVTSNSISAVLPRPPRTGSGAQSPAKAAGKRSDYALKFRVLKIRAGEASDELLDLEAVCKNCVNIRQLPNTQMNSVFVPPAA